MNFPNHYSGQKNLAIERIMTIDQKLGKAYTLITDHSMSSVVSGAYATVEGYSVADGTGYE